MSDVYISMLGWNCWNNLFKSRKLHNNTHEHLPLPNPTHTTVLFILNLFALLYLPCLFQLVYFRSRRNTIYTTVTTNCFNQFVPQNECPEKSAMREAMEEGGVVGSLGRFLGSFDNPERRHRTRVYVLMVSHLMVIIRVKDFFWVFFKRGLILFFSQK